MLQFFTTHHDYGETVVYAPPAFVRHGARHRTSGDGALRNTEQANEVINPYEQESPAQNRPGTQDRKPVRKGGTPEPPGGPGGDPTVRAP